MTTADRIRALREKQGLTQEELGAKCGITKQTIFKYENGIISNIPIKRIIQIAKVLHCEPEYLACWEDTLPAANTNIDDHTQEVNRRFADLCHRRRVNIGMSIDEVAAKANVDAAKLEAFENGEYIEPALVKVENIAKALQVTPTYLFGWRVGEVPRSEVPLILEAREAFMALDADDQRQMIDLMKAKKLLKDAEKEKDAISNAG